MAFSFNPNSQAPQAGQPGVQPTFSQPAGGAQDSSVSESAVPDSPILYLRYRGQPEIPVNAYLQLLLMVVAVVSIFIALVLFGYGLYLSSNINSKKAALAAANASAKSYPIEDMKRLSDRYTSLGKLMKDYVSIRTPLKLLEDVVEKQVFFSEFNLSKNRQASGYTMNFTIVTTNYRSLIQQLEAINLAQYSKVIPKSKVGGLTDGLSTLKVSVSAPIYAQGLLSDDVVFVSPTQAPVSAQATTTP